MTSMLPRSRSTSLCVWIVTQCTLVKIIKYWNNSWHSHYTFCWGKTLITNFLRNAFKVFHPVWLYNIIMIVHKFVASETFRLSCRMSHFSRVLVQSLATKITLTTILEFQQCFGLDSASIVANFLSVRITYNVKKTTNVHSLLTVIYYNFFILPLCTLCTIWL